ncbi:uncharacterized protein LOC135084779 [Ostrinia nubilalis]|uniref:uncharacterized protein LOC135084779 n=1 Tax=Ostrinia nubilalis TaxID=29057 RepID=UPI0030822F82
MRHSKDNVNNSIIAVDSSESNEQNATVDVDTSEDKTIEIYNQTSEVNVNATADSSAEDDKTVNETTAAEFRNSEEKSPKSDSQEENKSTPEVERKEEEETETPEEKEETPETVSSEKVQTTSSENYKTQEDKETTEVTSSGDNTNTIKCPWCKPRKKPHQHSPLVNRDPPSLINQYLCFDWDIYPDPKDCSRYYKCERGRMRHKRCHDYMEFSHRHLICMPPQLALCTTEYGITTGEPTYGNAWPHFYDSHSVGAAVPIVHKVETDEVPVQPKESWESRHVYSYVK